MHGGPCVVGGHAWQRGAHDRGHACGERGGSVCMAGETATAAGCTHPTGMHSCFQSSFSQFSQK